MFFTWRGLALLTLACCLIYVPVYGIMFQNWLGVLVGAAVGVLTPWSALLGVLIGKGIVGILERLE
jgi:hypothetical protein